MAELTKLGFMDETLAPIIAKGSKCVDPVNLEITVDEDGNVHMWKVVTLIGIFIVYVIKMIGLLHQRHSLFQSEETQNERLEK